MAKKAQESKQKGVSHGGGILGSVEVQAKTGRPSLYSEELAERILDMISDGVPLSVICEADEMPSRGTVRRWRVENAGFRTLYAQAREDFAHSLADDMLKLADRSREGIKTKEGKDGVEITTGDMVERSRLQLETRKWLASKILPKKYGDKLDVTTAGEKLEGNTLHITREVIGGK